MVYRVVGDVHRGDIKVLSRFSVHIRFNIGDIELFEFMYGGMLSTLYECGSRFKCFGYKMN